MMWGWGNSGWNWVAMFLMMAVFWGGIIVLVVYAFRGWGGERTDRRRDGRSDARDILEERFAKGEISQDEFEERRQVLEHAR